MVILHTTIPIQTVNYRIEITVDDLCRFEIYVKANIDISNKALINAAVDKINETKTTSN